MVPRGNKFLHELCNVTVNSCDLGVSHSIMISERYFILKSVCNINISHDGLISTLNIHSFVSPAASAAEYSSSCLRVGCEANICFRLKGHKELNHRILHFMWDWWGMGRLILSTLVVFWPLFHFACFFSPFPRSVILHIESKCQLIKACLCRRDLRMRC